MHILCVYVYTVPKFILYLYLNFTKILPQYLTWNNLVWINF